MASKCVSEHRFVVVKGQWINSCGLEGLVCVYAPMDKSERSGFSDTLVQFIGQWECQNFVIFGDFNSVLNSEERWGVHGFGVAFKKLVSFVDSLGLYNLPFGGLRFTFFENGSERLGAGWIAF